MMRKTLTILLLFLITLASHAQYRPQGQYIVCNNGKNKYTRALYGGPTDFRVETSDRPIFALYKSKNYRNVRFWLDNVPLDSTASCEARYGNAMREYTLCDPRWGSDARLQIVCLARHGSESTVWQFRKEGKWKQKSSCLICRMCRIMVEKLHRNGDIGVDQEDSFDPSVTEEGLETVDIGTAKRSFYAISSAREGKDAGYALALTDDEATERMFNDEVAYYRSLCSRIRFSTPDDVINLLGPMLTAAAEGVWDGETWLHGAVGWRMPLAGWRAGYLGDVLGWPERAVRHFDAYARSQVTDVPPTIPNPTPSVKDHLARAEKKWGTQMYSNGYICRNPNRNDQMHHYDMNLNYIDELLWHFEYDVDTTYLCKMWPVLKRHLKWEKRNFDADGNHLYDAYCCIWASDALYYSGGDVTHSSAYNYRGNLLAAKVARIIGEDATPYQQEADAILKMMNERLWTTVGHRPDRPTIPHWAEYRDNRGMGRLHPSAAVWSIYTPIDCGIGTIEQNYQCAQYIKKVLPHVAPHLISTSDWMPYCWSINNVAFAETMHAALALFEAGDSKEGYDMLRANIVDEMYEGRSPGNFGQISKYDVVRGECYRDFGDNIGISARAIIQGLFGVVPNALDGKCMIRPGFPMKWEKTEVCLPYLTYQYARKGNYATLRVKQNFKRPLKMFLRLNDKDGRYVDIEGTDATEQCFIFNVKDEEREDSSICQMTVSNDVMSKVLDAPAPMYSDVIPVEIRYNADVSDIFKEQYVSPRPMGTALQIPVQGVGEWCHPAYNTQIAKGHPVAFCSLWDNYPDSIDVPVSKCANAHAAELLIAGSTNHMQMYIENALVIALYDDNTTDTLSLIPPYNYVPIEQDYRTDNGAFYVAPYKEIGATHRPERIPFDGGGAAQRIIMQLDKTKKIKAFRMKCLSNDIVVGLMGLSLLTG